MLLGAGASEVIILGGFSDPERRYVYLLFTLLGLVFTFKALIAWKERGRT